MNDQTGVSLPCIIVINSIHIFVYMMHLQKKDWSLHKLECKITSILPFHVPQSCQPSTNMRLAQRVLQTVEKRKQKSKKAGEGDAQLSLVGREIDYLHCKWH